MYRSFLLLFLAKIAPRFNLMLGIFQKFSEGHAPRPPSRSMLRMLSVLCALCSVPLVHCPPLYQPFAEYAPLDQISKIIPGVCCGCVCVCVCVCAHACVCVTRVRVCMGVFVHGCIRACVYVYMHV